MLNWLFKRKSAASGVGAAEHAVLLRIPTVGQWPDGGGMERVHALEDDLIAAVGAAGTGEVDGAEWGQGEGTIFLYGPDADRLWGSIEREVRAAGLPSGSQAIKRYGEPGAREERVEIG